MIERQVRFVVLYHGNNVTSSRHQDEGSVNRYETAGSPDDGFF